MARKRKQKVYLGNRYWGIKKIGEGGFSVVWAACSEGKVQVAVKTVRGAIEEEGAQRELTALEAVKELRHPFLVSLHAFWVWHGRLRIAMDLADRSLGKRLKECLSEKMTGVPLGELLHYIGEAGEAGEALDYCHSKGVVHRDIKPDNILIRSGHAAVADLGMARVFEGRGLMAATTEGTPQYMAQEVWHGKVCAQSNLYSLAVSYVECRLGRQIFPRADLGAVCLAHCGEEPDLSPLPEAEARVMLKALHKDPSQRYESCQAWMMDLKQAVLGQTPLPKSLSTGSAAYLSDQSTAMEGVTPTTPDESNPCSMQVAPESSGSSFIRVLAWLAQRARRVAEVFLP